MSSGTNLLVRLPQTAKEDLAAAPLRRLIDQLGLQPPFDPISVAKYKRLKLNRANRLAHRQWAQAGLVVLGLLCIWSLLGLALFPHLKITLIPIAAVIAAVAITAIAVNATTHYFEDLPGQARWEKIVLMPYQGRGLREARLPREAKEQVHAISRRWASVHFVIHELHQGKLLDPFLEVWAGNEEYFILCWDETGFVT